jgi:hypothetical protein
MGEQVLRFLAGGALVASFALLGDLFQPKSFAGLFAAAPSVALATLGLTIHQRGTSYGAIEARSMIVGAAAFFVYASAVSWSLNAWRPKPRVAALSCVALWFAVAAGGWWALLSRAG